VLNLSENKLDVQCLVVIAEALVRLRFSFFLFLISFGVEIQFVFGNVGFE
jgi:hypothetical protein